ncbi:methyl-accepting chemotaxis protein [Acuticoccus sp. M5D2P5]|uniref:methyl-accepting chemotaxis protein n=1 Tax=Acuticoccus kalidii TaxID=2910977 RepID=UPI001F1856D2|nr:cache domain-containing protein [Acuticoccus kalidii]MCF3936037.1 methyl-accepting chemotaxis protein [Acuticoccus kalidii]
MMGLYRRLSISAKLWLLAGINLISLIVLVNVLVPQARTLVLDLEVGKVRSLSEAAANLARGLEMRAQAGEFSRDEAKARFVEAIHAMWYDDHKEYLFAIDLDGTVFAHAAKPELEGQSLWNFEDKAGLKLFQALSAAAREGGGSVSYWWPKPGSDDPMEKISYVVPLSEWGIYVGTGVYTDRIDSAFASLNWAAAFVTLIAMAVVVFASWLIARDISRPAGDLASKITRLAQGEVVAESAYGRRRDAIGSLARAVTALRGVVIERIELQQAQTKASEERRQERALAMQQLADSLDASVSDDVDAMQESMQAMVSRAEAMRDIAERMRTTTEETYSACESGHESVDIVARAAEELSASSREIARQISGNATASDRAVEAAEGAALSISTLAKASRSIGEVTRLINDIAEQTNLLALNATIEAARAGEAGRGFSVVAHEVKSLAEQTGKATGNIEAQIRAMQAETNQSVEAINGIVTTVTQLSANTAAMATALEEQDSSIREIASSIALAAESSDAISRNMSRMRSSVDETRSAADTVCTTTTSLDHQSLGVKSSVESFLSNLRHANDAGISRRTGS